MQTLWANQKAKGFSEIQVAICQTFKWKWKMNETKDFFAKVRHWFLSCLISEYHLSSVFFFRLLNVNFNEAFQSFRHDGGRPYSCWAATIKMSSTTKLCGFFNWRRTVCYTRTIRIKGYFKLHFPFLKGFKAFFCAEVTIFPRFFYAFPAALFKNLSAWRINYDSKNEYDDKRWSRVHVFNRMFTNVRAEALKKEEERLSLVNK